MRHRRNEFPLDVKRQALARSKGICECHLMPWIFPSACGRPLGEGNTFYEHIHPDRISGRNDLDNAATLTKTCWHFKTNSYDKPVIARVRKREDRSHGIRPAPTLPGSRRDPFKKTMRGQVVDRQSGQPWRGW